MVDIVALMPQTKAGGFVGVSVYVDDQGIAKELPINRRATGFSMACGLQVRPGARL